MLRPNAGIDDANHDAFSVEPLGAKPAWGIETEEVTGVVGLDLTPDVRHDGRDTLEVRHLGGLGIGELHGETVQRGRVFGRDGAVGDSDRSACLLVSALESTLCPFGRPGVEPVLAELGHEGLLVHDDDVPAGDDIPVGQRRRIELRRTGRPRIVGCASWSQRCHRQRHNRQDDQQPSRHGMLSFAHRRAPLRADVLHSPLASGLDADSPSVGLCRKAGQEASQNERSRCRAIRGIVT